MSCWAQARTALGKSLQEDDSPLLLEEIVRISVGQRVNVTVEVISIGEITEVKKKNGEFVNKMELPVGDALGACRLVLWQEQVSAVSKIKYLLRS